MAFDDRREGYEKKFALDEESRFKATARRNKLLGLWAAGQLGRTGPDADAYAKTVVAADFEEAGDGDVIRKVLADLQAGGVGASEASIKAKLEELMGQAAAEIASGR